MKTLANCMRAAKARKLKSVGQYRKPLTEVEVEAELGWVKRESVEVKMRCDLLNKFLRYFAKEPWGKPA